MAAPVFIGDEVTAAGLRLAGCAVEIPRPGQAAEMLARARRSAELILMTASEAATVPSRELDEALRGPSPLLLIIPDINATREPPDMETRIRALLGIDA
jgi:vacuolar-type H+-ATPase subunit F/Vma7